jgi:hypothetical protein
LFELAGELVDDLAEREIGVRVRFSEPAGRSSTMPIARKLGDMPDFDAAVGDEETFGER